MTQVPCDKCSGNGNISFLKLGLMQTIKCPTCEGRCTYSAHRHDLHVKGQAMRTARLKMGYTIRQAGEMCDLRALTISRIEQGEEDQYTAAEKEKYRNFLLGVS